MDDRLTKVMVGMAIATSNTTTTENRYVKIEPNG